MTRRRRQWREEIVQNFGPAEMTIRISKGNAPILSWKGNLEDVPLGDRERAVMFASKFFGLSYEVLYERLWKNVGKTERVVAIAEEARQNLLRRKPEFSFQ